MTLAACVLGVGIPAYREYKRQRIVKLIRVEVDKGLAHAESQMLENPETALLQMQVLRECLHRAPSLTDAERREFEPEFERLHGVCARQIKIKDSERWMYSCGVRNDAETLQISTD